MIIPVMTPRVGGAVANYLEGFAYGMVAPDAALDVYALFLGGAGNTNLGAGAKDSVPTVEPSVGAPA